MKIITNNIAAITDTWNDPGDYPSGAGSGPLASFDYIAELQGTVIVRFDKDDFLNVVNLDEPDLRGDILAEVFDDIAVKEVKFDVKKIEAAFDNNNTFLGIDVTLEVTKFEEVN